MKLTKEMQLFYESLKEQPKTQSMVCAETGILQKNTCRYKRKLEKANLLWEVKRTHCKKTGFRASYLTTNEDLKPPQSQLQLFD